MRRQTCDNVLGHFGEKKAAGNLESAIYQIISDGKTITHGLKPDKKTSLWQ